MKVLFLSSNMGLFGAEGVIINLFKNLPASVEPILANFVNARNPHFELAEVISRQGHKVYNVNCASAFDLDALKQLTRICAAEQIDLIHSHGYKADLYGLALAKKTRIPILSTLHSLCSDTKKVSLYVKLQKFLLRYFNLVVCVSQEIHELMSQAAVKSERLLVIDNGIDLSVFARTADKRSGSRKTFALADEQIVFGTAGRLSVEKGIDVFLKAAAVLAPKYPEVLFLIAGQGAEEEHLKKMRGDLGITEQVRFIGLVTDMSGFYAALDLYVLPSLSEGLPLVILEAMAAELPIVASRVGAVGEVVINERTGYLVRPGVITELVSAWERFLANREQAPGMGQAAREIVAAKFSAAVMAEKYYNVYEQILAKEGMK